MRVVVPLCLRVCLFSSLLIKPVAYNARACLNHFEEAAWHRRPKGLKARLRQKFMSAHVGEVAHHSLEPGRRRFTVQAFADGLLSSFGHDPVIAIRDFEGEVELVPGTLE